MLSNQSANPRRMDQVVAGLPTKSAQIRALAAEGYSRSEIAKFLDIRYQHVRNVLVQSAPETMLQKAKTTVGPGGRVLIPAAYRQALGLSEGEEVMLRIENDQLILESRKARLRRAQEMAARYLKGDDASADAFLAERRREAEREKADDR